MSRILVTGGSRGIGRSICLRAARDAMSRGETPKIVVSGTGTSSDLDNVVTELRELGAEAMAVTGNLGDPDTPAHLVDEAVKFCGGLDALVHNAGGAIAGTLLKTSTETWDTVFNINCRAFFLLGKAAQPALKASAGVLCAIGSNAAERVQPFLNAYPPSKAALVMLVQQMAFEWGRYGIRVNAVSPGLTQSRSTEAALSSEQSRELMGSQIPLGRVGVPEDIAGAVAFVIGPDSAFMTGQNINIDGGMGLPGPDILREAEGKWSAQNDGGMLHQK